MSLIRNLIVLAAAAGSTFANPILPRADNSTCSVSLSSSPDCNVVGGGPGLLEEGTCYNVSVGIQSFEFYEQPSSYKIVSIFDNENCDGVNGKGASYSAEALGCLRVGFTGYSVVYHYG